MHTYTFKTGARGDKKYARYENCLSRPESDGEIFSIEKLLWYLGSQATAKNINFRADVKTLAFVFALNSFKSSLLFC